MSIDADQFSMRPRQRLKRRLQAPVDNFSGVSAACGIVECMFESVTDGELLEVMRDAQRGERMAFARELLAAGRFTLQRIAASGQDYLECALTQRKCA
jgi:hypothetical protein